MEQARPPSTACGLHRSRACLPPRKTCDWSRLTSVAAHPTRSRITEPDARSIRTRVSTAQRKGHRNRAARATRPNPQAPTPTVDRKPDCRPIRDASLSPWVGDELRSRVGPLGRWCRGLADIGILLPTQDGCRTSSPRGGRATSKTARFTDRLFTSRTLFLGGSPRPAVEESMRTRASASTGSSCS